MQICQRNPRIACSTDHVSNIPLRELNLNLKNEDDIYKSAYHPRSIYSSRPTQLYHFQADLIWCDGTFMETEFLDEIQTKFLKFSSLLFTVTSTALPGDFSKLTQPDRKPYPLPYGLRNPYTNLKSENYQDCTQKQSTKLYVHELCFSTNFYAKENPEVHRTGHMTYV
jgi:hypothetical protein